MADQFFFLLLFSPSKNWRLSCYSVSGLLFLVYPFSRNCLSHDGLQFKGIAHKKTKQRKMIHDRWQSIRDAIPAWCLILALMDFALQSDTPVACPRQFSYREDSRRFILMISLLLCLLQFFPPQFLWSLCKSTHVKVNAMTTPGRKHDEPSLSRSRPNPKETNSSQIRSNQIYRMYTWQDSKRQKQYKSLGQGS